MAQSTVKLIVDAQNAIVPLKRVNEQTKALSSSTDKLKGRLDRSNRSLKNTGSAAKTASAGVGTLVGALKPLLAALAVVQSAKFVLFQTAQLETQTKALENFTGSAEKAQEIVQEIKEFGAVTPFKSSQLIEVTRKLKAFGFETEKVVDMTKRIADIAGTAGADIDRVAFAIGKVQAKNKFMQEENMMLLEKGVNIQKELQEVTGLTGDELAKAMSKGEVGADKFVQALVKATSVGGQFFEGAVNQSDTLAGKFSTLVDNVETFAQNLGKIFEDPLKEILDMLNQVASEFNKLFSMLSDTQIGASNRNVGSAVFKARLGMQADAVADIEKAVNLLDPSFVKTEKDAAKLAAQVERIQKAITLIQGPDSLEVLDKRGLADPLIDASLKLGDINKQARQNVKAQKQLTIETKKTKDNTEKTTLAFKEIMTPTDLLNANLGKTNLFVKKIDKNIFGVETTSSDLANNFANINSSLANNVSISDLFNQGLGQTSFLVKDLSLGTDKFSNLLENVKSDADQLKEKFMEIGQGIEQGIVSNLTDAVMGTQTLAQAAVNVLNQLKRKLVEVAIQRAVSGIGNFIGGALGGIFGGGSSVNQFVGRASAAAFRANGGPVSAGGAFVVGEKGPELLQMGTRGGNIIPNNQLGGSTTNIVNVSVDASGSTVSGNTPDAQQLGNLIGVAIQERLIKEKRSGGLLSR